LEPTIPTVPSLDYTLAHFQVFEDEEVDEDDIAQAHTSSNQSIVASVHQSDPAQRAIQANTSTLRNSEESKYQDPEERGLLYMATHKMTKSNRQIDVNNAFSKAVEKKSLSQVTWDNDIEQPTSQRPKKTQLRVNMANRKKVVFRDDGTMVETPDDEEQDTPCQLLPTPRTTVSTRLRINAANCGNRGRPRPAMTVASGRGRGYTPGSNYYGAGGQGGRGFRAPAPDGRTHLIPRSIHNAPPQQTVNEQYVPGVSILPVTPQALLNRCMAETNLNLRTSHTARSRHQLPTDDTSNSQQNWLNIGNIPSPTGVREDGTLEGLDEGTNSRRYSSSRAMVPYDVQPDPIVSQRAIVPSAPRELAVGNNASTLAVRQTSYGLRTSASNYARRIIEGGPTREVFSEKTVPCMDLVSTG